MKKATKALLAILCVVLLVAGSVMATLAYLTDSDEVKNTVTVGKVDITVDESEVTPDGEPVDGADRVDGNEYHLIPGQSYVKDPTMTVKKGSEESYVRMLVSVNCLS
jgi:predicted ribosomally synthesized peptide with SipW-like signal peptide